MVLWYADMSLRSLLLEKGTIYHCRSYVDRTANMESNTHSDIVSMGRVDD